MNNPSVYKHMGFTPPILLDKTMEWFERNQSLTSRQDVTFVDDEGRIIGFGGVTGIDSNRIKGETYTFLAPEYHGQGLGTRANYLLTKYAFQEMGLHKIYAAIDETNIASCRMKEKLNFILEGTLRDEKIKDGLYVNRRYYGMLSGEFQDGLFPMDSIDREIE